MFFLNYIFEEVIKFICHVTAAVVLGTLSNGRLRAQPYNSEPDSNIEQSWFGYRQGHTIHIREFFVTIIGFVIWVAVVATIVLVVIIWPDPPQFHVAE